VLPASRLSGGHRDVGGNSVPLGPRLQATKSGAALREVPKLSKYLVSYMEGLLAVSPNVNGPFDSQSKGVAESVAAAALSDLSQLANEPYMAYLKRKLGEWHSEAPRPASKQPAVDADEPAPAADESATTRRRQPRPTLPLVESTVVVLYSIRKALRPESDARGSPERAPDWERIVPGLHSAVFGYRQQ
jgi:hypothetical protein